MSWSTEELMAYADGEMSAASRDALERDLSADAALRQRVDALRVQRERVAAAYASVIDEPVPEHLSALLEGKPSPAVAPARAANDSRWHSAWAAWGGMAACLVAGVLIGARLPADDGSLVRQRDGQPVAAGPLAEALSTRLASEDGDMRSSISFIDKQGHYCRTFSSASLAGLACHDGDRWSVVQLASSGEAPEASDAMRQAATALPRSVLEAVDQRIAGVALDAQAERRARDQGWKR